MPVLVEQYNPVVYDNLMEVEEVDKLVNEDEKRAVGNVIIKYGYEDKVHVILAHKHHVIANNEAMMDGNRKSGSDTIVSTPAPLEEIIKKGAKPSVIVLGGDGKKQFFPVAFAMLDEEDVQAWNDLEFLKAVASLFVEKGLANKLMLGVKTTGALDVKYIERNYLELRISELRPLADGIIPVDTIKTSYYFNSKPDGNGNMIAVMGCSVSCLRSDGSHIRDHVFTW